MTLPLITLCCPLYFVILFILVIETICFYRVIAKDVVDVKFRRFIFFRRSSLASTSEAEDGDADEGDDDDRRDGDRRDDRGLVEVDDRTLQVDLVVVVHRLKSKFVVKYI